MTNQPATDAPTTPGPEHEGREAKRIWAPFALAIGLVVLVLVIVFAITQPWEDSDTAQRDVSPEDVPTQPLGR